MTKEIELTQGYVAIVDDEDYEEISKHKWYAKKCRNKVYAVSGSHIYMHVLIMLPSDGVIIDHRDGNGLNCTRGNMRYATYSQNGLNRGKSVDNTSGYKGVSFNKARGKWQVRISINGTETHIGLFDNVEDAARAYDRAALEFHGEFASTNF